MKKYLQKNTYNMIHIWSWIGKLLGNILVKSAYICGQILREEKKDNLFKKSCSFEAFFLL